MTELCQRVIEGHPVRKGAARKRAFREYVRAELRKMGIYAREERTGGWIKNANLVVGNAESAEWIFGAHYDTCAELPFPNLSTPLNWPLSLLFQLLLYVVLAGAALLISRALSALGAPGWLSWSAMALAFIGLTALLVAGPANPNAMNDNTSGVVALLTLLERMTPAQRRRVCVVLFDNEELGLIGSALFRRRHRKAAAGTPMLNLDCVGDGEHMLLAASKALRADEMLYGRLRAAFPDRGDIAALHVPAARALYPSDQLGFSKSAAVAALNRRWYGYALERIHTRRDTVLSERNIEYLVEGLLKLLADEDE